MCKTRNQLLRITGHDAPALHASPRPRWRPDRGGRPAGAPRGRALTQEPSGITLPSHARRKENPQRAGSDGTGRAQRRRCLPLCP
jgi:hypothetical protein